MDQLLAISRHAPAPQPTGAATASPPRCRRPAGVHASASIKLPEVRPPCPLAPSRDRRRAESPPASGGTWGEGTPRAGPELLQPGLVLIGPQLRQSTIGRLSRQLVSGRQSLPGFHRPVPPPSERSAITTQSALAHAFLIRFARVHSRRSPGWLSLFCGSQSWLLEAGSGSGSPRRRAHRHDV